MIQLLKGLAQACVASLHEKKEIKLLIPSKVVDVIANDSLANIEYQKAMEKDAPSSKERAGEMMEKAKADMKTNEGKRRGCTLKNQAKKPKLVKEIEIIQPQKLQPSKHLAGAYMKIDERGTGAAATTGNMQTVTYTGKYLKPTGTL